MATIYENHEFYENYDWSTCGEEWADAWGGSDMQWYGSILPRIHLFLPARTILEIGAGYGRWVKYFLPYCEKLILTDMTKQCVDTCRERYSDNAKINCIHNDGSSLGFVANNQVDFIFSYHSLVHADDATMEKYVSEIAGKLTANGVAFLHHSNAGEYINDLTIDKDLIVDYRDTSMTAKKMQKFARSAGLRCSAQELVNWETRELLDCFTILARPNSLWGRSEKLITNHDFRGEMAYFGRLSEIYGRGQTSASSPYLYRFAKEPVNVE